MIIGKNVKAQSAMEYLMTYGWAILIIGVVLVALFALGIFNGSSFVGSSCTAVAGFQCSAYSLTSSGFAATISQSTGTSWLTANVFFLGPGVTAPPSSFNGLVAGCEDSIAGGLTPGQTASILLGNYIGSSTACTSNTLPPTAFPSTVGQSISGQLWAAYTTTAGGSSVFYTQVAQVNVKVT